MSQFTGTVGVIAAPPEQFVILMIKDTPGTIVPTDRTKVPWTPDVNNITEFAVTEVVATVARTAVAPLLRLDIGPTVNFPTEEAPAETAVAGFPTRTFAGRREP
jgi:hypothetical protein